MKLTATGLLVAAAVVYAASLRWHGVSAGFVRTGSEAAMVGGLADWFAVTALFRRPLGLPLPHTALIPRQKDQLATELGSFVRRNFVTTQAVVEQLAKADIVERLARQLADPEVAKRIGREVAFNAGVVLRHLRDEDVVSYVHELLRHDLARRSYAPVLGRLMERAVEGEVQRPLVDVVAGRAAIYVRTHREQLVPQVRGFVDSQSWLASLLLTDRRIRNVLDGVATTLRQVERDPQHPLRRWLDGLLASVADGLQHDAATAAELDRVLVRLLDDPHAQAALHDLVVDGLDSVRLSLAHVDDPLQERVTAFVTSVGSRLAVDEEFRDRVRTTVATLAAHVVDNYGDELVHLIQTQVARLDAGQVSRMIELEVGGDLQFIRLNGTAVGALAGLAIHAVTLALS